MIGDIEANILMETSQAKDTKQGQLHARQWLPRNCGEEEGGMGVLAQATKTH